jgi:hypothetical protein
MLNKRKKTYNQRKYKENIVLLLQNSSAKDKE